MMNNKKRLTIEEMGEQIRCYVPYGKCNDCTDCDHADRIRRKLASYERACDEPVKVAEWAKADSEGRLVVLPCKVGDTVYEALRMWDGSECLYSSFKPHVRERTVIYIALCRGERVVIGSTNSDCLEIGKDAFVTRKEAEAAIAAEGGRDER